MKKLVISMTIFFNLNIICLESGLVDMPRSARTHRKNKSVCVIWPEMETEIYPTMVKFQEFSEPTFDRVLEENACVIFNALLLQVLRRDDFCEYAKKENLDEEFCHTQENFFAVKIYQTC